MSKKPSSPSKLPATQRALALHQQGNLAAAEPQYRDALAANAQDDQALLGLSLLLARSNRARDAVDLLWPVLKSGLDSAELWIALSDAQVALGLKREAAHSLRRALTLKSLPEAWFRLGELEEAQSQPRGAAASFTQAAALRPDDVLLQLRLADCLWSQGEAGRALGHYQAAVNAGPRSLPALLGLAQALRALRLYEAALLTSERALALEPRNHRALEQKGYALLGREMPAAAATCFRQALLENPRSSSAHYGYTSAAFQTGLATEAADSARRAIALKPERRAHSNLVFQLAFVPGVTAEQLLGEARAWAHQWADSVPQLPPVRADSIDPERRLRVGYVSPDFRDHCQALYMLPLLAAHDRAQFEVTCYAGVAQPDALTERLKALADGWRDVGGLDDAALAQRIRDDGVDILVDLTMHMAGNRLPVFARRPAPVQIAWLAYPGTTGMSQIDYRVTDRHIDPPPAELSSSDFPLLVDDARYRERSLVLPDSFWCFDPLERELEVAPLPATRSGHLTFGCLGNLAKVNVDVLSLWARVLCALPSSRLLLRAPPGEPRGRLAAALAAAGVEPERVEFVDRQPRAAYLATYQRIDVCLDTFPYNGHTTSLDAHWMGVPVVTRVGSTVVGRAGLCQARNLDLAFLVAEDDDAFVRAAVELASDLPRLAALRAGLRARMEGSPLMDAPRFARNLERAYRQAWRLSCSAATAASDQSCSQ